MAERALRFACRECDRGSLRWEGRCPGCDAWNALEPAAGRAPRARRGMAGGRLRIHATAAVRDLVGWVRRAGRGGPER